MIWIKALSARSVGIRLMWSRKNKSLLSTREVSTYSIIFREHSPWSICDPLGDQSYTCNLSPNSPRKSPNHPSSLSSEQSLNPSATALRSLASPSSDRCQPRPFVSAWILSKGRLMQPTKCKVWMDRGINCQKCSSDRENLMCLPSTVKFLNRLVSSVEPFVQNAIASSHSLLPQSSDKMSSQDNFNRSVSGAKTDAYVGWTSLGPWYPIWKAFWKGDLWRNCKSSTKLAKFGACMELNNVAIQRLERHGWTKRVISLSLASVVITPFNVSICGIRISSSCMEIVNFSSCNAFWRADAK